MNLTLFRYLRPVIAAGLIALLASPAQAVAPTRVEAADWFAKILSQLTDPLFWFGMVAQFLFFMRFIWQWMVSEKRQRSTVPIIFWYFSLAGGTAMFIYGCLRVDLVIMLGQSLAIVIYSRNLMLIYKRSKRMRQAGFPVVEVGSEVD